MGNSEFVQVYLNFICIGLYLFQMQNLYINRYQIYIIYMCVCIHRDLCTGLLNGIAPTHGQQC